MASLYDETNDKTYRLEPNVPFIIGRGDKLGIQNPHVSRNQLEVNLLEDGRCFIKRHSANPSLLNGKILPLHKEIELFDGHTIEVIARSLPVFKVILPDSKEPDRNIVVPPTAPSAIEGEKYYYDENNVDEYQTQRPSLFPYNEDDDDNEDMVPGKETTSDEDEPVGVLGGDDESDGWVSSESSLLGDERWSDEEDENVVVDDDNIGQKKTAEKK